MATVDLTELSATDINRALKEVLDEIPTDVLIFSPRIHSLLLEEFHAVVIARALSFQSNGLPSDTETAVQEP